MVTPITLASSNINGLYSSLPNIPSYINQNGINLLCVQETHRFHPKIAASFLARHSLNIQPNAPSSVNQNQKTGTACIVTHSISNLIKSQTIVLENRIQALFLEYNNSITLIINVYLQSGNSAQNTTQRFETLNILADFLRNARYDNMIMADDFNMVLLPIDKTNKLNKRKDHYLLQQILDFFNLTDPLRDMHPNAVIYTYIRSNTAPRIDRVYTSKTLSPLIQSYTHI